MNPNALVMWGLFSGVGYLIDGGHGAVVGLVGGLAISFLATMALR